MPFVRMQDADEIIFECNICGAINETKLDRLGRDDPSCSRCGSCVRFRALIRALTTELFGRSVNISEIRPRHFEILGCGMSCWDGYSSRLKRRVDFKNTFFHKKPYLDITDISREKEGELDFLIASDVFEHIVPPVQRAFDNARKLLKDDGIFVITVPFTHPGEENIAMQEHYPDLFDYKVKQDDGSFVLENISRDGIEQVYREPKFHGGPGSTLEMRIFSEYSLISSLRAAGFEKIAIHGGVDLAHGIFWQNRCSVPLTARVKDRAPGFVHAHKPLLSGPSLLQKVGFVGRRALAKVRPRGDRDDQG